MTFVREAVAKSLWVMTEKTNIIVPEQWVINATVRLQVQFYWQDNNLKVTSELQIYYGVFLMSSFIN